MLCFKSKIEKTCRSKDANVERADFFGLTLFARHVSPQVLRLLEGGFALKLDSSAALQLLLLLLLAFVFLMSVKTEPDTIPNDVSVGCPPPSEMRNSTPLLLVKLSPRS